MYVSSMQHTFNTRRRPVAEIIINNVCNCHVLNLIFVTENFSKNKKSLFKMTNLEYYVTCVCVCLFICARDCTNIVYSRAQYISH